MANSLVTNLYTVPAGTIADERLAVSSTAVAFASIPTPWTSASVEYVDWDVQTNDVMVTFDGSDPTSTNGHRLYAGQSGTWALNRARAAKFIRVSADAVVHASPSTT